MKLEAREYAKIAHEGQVRKYTGEPYFNHCENVAKLVEEKLKNLNIKDDSVVAAAYLHDVVEDTKTTLEDIKFKFGDFITNLVEELTDVYTHEAYPTWNRSKRKLMEAERLASISNYAKIIKWCDLADNTSTIVEYDPGFAKIYLKEKAFVLYKMGF